MLTILRFAVETRSETNILPRLYLLQIAAPVPGLRRNGNAFRGISFRGFHADRGRIRRMGGRFLCLHASQPVVIK